MSRQSREVHAGVFDGVERSFFFVRYGCGGCHNGVAIQFADTEDEAVLMVLVVQGSVYDVKEFAVASGVKGSGRL